MSCDRTHEQLTATVDAQQPLSAECRQHLATCSVCRDYQNALMAVDRQLAKEAEEQPEMPSFLHAKIMLMMRRESACERFDWNMFRPAVTAAVAAGLLLFIGSWSLRMLEGMRPDPAIAEIPPETYQLIVDVKTTWEKMERTARDVASLPARPVGYVREYPRRAAKEVLHLAVEPIERELGALVTDIKEAAFFLVAAVNLESS